ncbi:hypothetical protein [Streptomyces sp. NBC_01766]|uniref:hypothetical protein n=1 Tax=Streptomyces sp. NBC_01766 TaxID=2975936 RepID=UPI002DDC5358|nr:hypothetical protein [Streptomyces sp. NBC_01766]WSC24917.1 hypothetical protein OIE60_35200 [Streptomyces sp. NBC_01766]
MNRVRRLRAAAVVAVLTGALVVGGASGAFAADGDDGQSGILGPLNVKTPEGVRLDHYELTGGGDGPIDTVMRFILTGIFALSRTLVGFACWLVDWAYRFPVIDKLTGPAQHVADAYQQHIVTPLGLAPLFLGWAFVFGLMLLMRGRRAQGIGEIALTLLISAIAATSFVRPDVMLGYNGPLQQTQRAALEAAVITADHGEAKTPDSPCDLISGPARATCQSDTAAAARSGDKKAQDAARREQCSAVAGPARDTCLSGDPVLAAGDVSKPITATLTTTLVVQPYMLLEYGRVLDKDDPLYAAHKKSLSPTTPAFHPNKACADLPGLAKDHCPDVNGVTQYDLDQDTAGSAALRPFNDAGKPGKAALNYMTTLTWERVIGALLVLIATVIVFLVILSMVIAMVAVQFGCVLAAVASVVVFAWAMLPGPNRSVLWKWVGVFAASSVVMFGVSVFIPAFGIGAQALLADSKTPMLERLLLLDGLAITALSLHRKMLRSGSSLGQRFAERMRYARVGGSHTMGENAAATGMALASLGVGSRGGGLPLGGAGGRGWRSQLASGLRALGDSEGMPGHPAGLLAEAAAEGRRALAPLRVGLGATHQAWVGKPRDGGESFGVKPGGKNGGPAPAQMIIDGNTGEIISNPAQGFTPVGDRLKARLQRTRGGRVMAATGKLAFNSTVGLPATWTRGRRRASKASEDMWRQVRHYDGVGARWIADMKKGASDLSTPARRGFNTVSRPLRDADRMRRWREEYVDENGYSYILPMHGRHGPSRRDGDPPQRNNARFAGWRAAAQRPSTSTGTGTGTDGEEE